ncbi:hypothetical protein [Archaeoglobus veneficus]|nr:hypothetical protein [Archaeoglobus veneficus]
MYARDVAEILGFSVLVGFTLVVTVLAVLAQGALIHFYEPNKLVWAIEVILGIYGVTIGIIKIKETVEKKGQKVTA